MRWLLYAAFRYGVTFAVAVWLGATRTPLLNVGAFALLVTASMALLARRRVGDSQVSIPMAFLFEMPGVVVASLAGWAMGAAVSH